MIKFAKKREKERATAPETSTSLYMCLLSILADQTCSYHVSLAIRMGENIRLKRPCINFTVLYTALFAAIELARWFMDLPPLGIDDSFLLVVYVSLICLNLFLIRDLGKQKPLE